MIIDSLEVLNIRLRLEKVALVRGCGGYAVVVHDFGCSLVTRQVTVEVVESTDVLVSEIYVWIVGVPGVHGQNVPYKVLDHIWLLLDLLLFKRDTLFR